MYCKSSTSIIDKINNILSAIADIGLDIVQGSAIGPTLHIVMKK